MSICFKRHIDVRLRRWYRLPLPKEYDCYWQEQNCQRYTELTSFAFEPIFVERRGEASENPFEQTNRIYTVDLNDTSAEFNSFSQKLLSSTERPIRKGQTGKNRSSIAKSNSWPRPLFRPFLLREEARDQLASGLREYHELFMKHKAVIGRSNYSQRLSLMEKEQGACLQTRRPRRTKKYRTC